MTITRIINGELISIDLTDSELFAAYVEQEKVFDLHTVQEFVRDECNLDDETFPPEFMTHMLEQTDTLRSWAEELREHKDDGWSWSAIEDSLRDYLYEERTEWLMDNPEYALEDEEIER